MAINITPKEMPTGDGNPTAGSAIKSVDSPTNDCNDKVVLTFQAMYALKGHLLHLTDPTDSPLNFRVEGCGFVRDLPSMDRVRQYLEQIGEAV